MLEEERDAHWSGWMRSARNAIAAGDPEGIDHFLAAFGGMGSFNDLASERSLAIAAKAYALAKALRPDEDEA